MVDLTKYMNKDLTQVTPSGIYGFAQLVDQIPGVIKLMIGEPDFNVPDHVKQAAINSVNANHSHYAPPKGTLGLRRAAATYLKDKYGLQYSPENEIIVTAGVTEAIYTMLISVLNPGDEVIIPTPVFPVYIPDTIMAGGKPILVDTSKDDFKLTPAKLVQLLHQHPQVRVLVLNYPANPTGVVYTQAELTALAQVISGKPIFVLCDEIYSELNYDQPYASMAKCLPEQTILMNGVSKSHAMTGYRIGIMCAPQGITSQLAKTHELVLTSVPTIMQDAGEEAFKGLKDSQEMKSAYRKRRDYLYQALNEIGFACLKPMGTFYLFAKIPDQLNQDDREFSLDLLHKAKVAVTAGSLFGPGGSGYIRISYATALDELKESVKRLKAYQEAEESQH